MHTSSHYSSIKKCRINVNGIKYLLIALPFVIFIFAFCYVPLFGWLYAFFDYKFGVPLFHSEFLGLKNFFQLFVERRETIRVFRNTLVMSMLGILSSPVPVIFAIMLNEVKNSRFKKLVQTTTTLPNFISWIVVFSISFSIFSMNGLINSILDSLHLPAQTSILGNADYVWQFQWAIGMWKSIGWSSIIYLAAISSIDIQQYDAAKIDGANRFQAILHVTLPGLASTYLVLLLLGLSNLLNTGFDQYFVFYNSMVADKIEVLDYYVYKTAMLINDYSYSVALGMQKTIISLILLFIVNFISKKFRGSALV